MQKIFSYPIQIDKLSAGEKRFSLAADKEQREWITQIFQVEDVKSFTADISVKSDIKNHMVKVKGTAKAEIEHQSVVSLENFVHPYEVDFEVLFDTKATYEQIRHEYEDINEDAPEIVEDGQIDLAKVAMEQIALVLDDYPRKDGEVFEFVSEFDEETTQKNNPFTVLAKIKK